MTDITIARNDKHFKLYPKLTVFVSSFCLMVLEIVAGRIMAPYLGVSLYTWTSIIGIVLAGISIGNYFGGRLADKVDNKRLLGFAFLFGGFSTSIIIFFSDLIGKALREFVSLPIATFLFSLAVFFLPSILLSFITPVVIKISLKDLNKTGSTVGQIYAFSVIGSIIGTLATGYFFISWFGTKFIIIGISAILFLMGMRFSIDFVNMLSKKLIIILLIFLGLGFSTSDKCYKESNYYCIKIIEYYKGKENELVVLQLDQLLHSHVSKNNYYDVGYSYLKTFAIMAESQKEDVRESDFLFLGGGGYTLPRYLEEVYPESSITVVEIDPEVTRLNYSDLWLSRDTKIVTHNVDARIYLQRLRDKMQFDVIYGDVFNDLSVPYHLTTFEFNEIIKRHLKDNGYYIVNIIDKYEIGKFLAAYVNTLKQSFDYVYIAPQAKDWREVKVSRNTYVVIAGQKSIDIEKWNVSAESLESTGIYKDDKKEDIAYLIYDKELENFFSKSNKKTVVLTDDYAPVDNMLAPVFRKKYRN